MATYNFSKQAQGFTLIINSGVPQTFANEEIATSRTDTVLTMRIGSSTYLHMAPDKDTITINGETFSGTTEELWEAISTDILDEGGGGEFSGTLDDIEEGATNKAFTAGEKEKLADAIISDEDSATAVEKIWSGSQEDYDAIVSPDPNTLYIIE